MAEPIQADAWVPEDSFGTRLLLLRRKLGLSQEEAARLCGLKPATWNTWEHGASPRNMAQAVEKIGAATGASKTWLMWGSALMYNRDLAVLDGFGDEQLGQRMLSLPVLTPVPSAAT